MKYQILLAIALIVLSSCKKDDEPIDHFVEPIEEPLNYFPLKVGNFWEFNEYAVYPNGEDSLQRTGIKMEIIGTQEINGNTYFEFNKSSLFLFFQDPMLVRDSSGFLVNPDGRVLMSNQNFGSTHAFGVSHDERLKRVSSATMLEHIHENKVLGSHVTAELHQFIRIDDTLSLEYGVHFAPNIGPFKRRYAYFVQWQNDGIMIELRLVDIHLN